MLAEGGDLGEDVLLKRLATEPGLDAHDEQEVEGSGDIEDCFDWGGRVEGESGGEAEASDVGGALDGTGRVADFDVKGEMIGTGPGEGFEELLGSFDHEMHIEAGVGEMFAQGAAHIGPHGQVGDEVAIHDVEVEKVGTAGEDGSAFVSHASEVG